MRGLTETNAKAKAHPTTYRWSQNWARKTIMRHMTFLRVYQPLNKLPEKVRGLAREATKLSRADIEAEAAERINHRLRPDTFSDVTSSLLTPIIRLVDGSAYS